MTVKLNWGDWATATEGSLALAPIAEAAAPISEPTAEPPLRENAHSPLQAAPTEAQPTGITVSKGGSPYEYLAQRPKERERALLVSAFKRNIKACQVVYYTVRRDREGRPRVVLECPENEKGRLYFQALRGELNSRPYLEAELLVWLSEKKGREWLRNELEERAAIRYADGLDGSLFEAAMSLIDADERATADGRARVAFQRALSKPR